MSLEIPRLFWPVVIGTGNDGFTLTVVGGSPGDYVGTVANATYQDPETLLAALRTGILAAGLAGNPADPFSGKPGASVGTGGVIDFTAGGVVSIALTLTGATAFTLTFTDAGLGTLLGFAGNPSDGSDPFALTADYQMQHFWTPDIPVELEEETADEYTRALVETAAQQVHLIENGASFQTKRVEFSHLPPERVYTARESGSTTNQAFQRFVSDATAIVQFRWWPDRATTATYGTYYLRGDSVQAWRPERMRDFGLGYHRYRFALDMGEHNS